MCNAWPVAPAPYPWKGIPRIRNTQTPLGWSVLERQGYALSCSARSLPNQNSVWFPWRLCCCQARHQHLRKQPKVCIRVACNFQAFFQKTFPESTSESGFPARFFLTKYARLISHMPICPDDKPSALKSSRTDSLSPSCLLFQIISPAGMAPALEDNLSPQLPSQ